MCSRPFRSHNMLLTLWKFNLIFFPFDSMDYCHSEVQLEMALICNNGFAGTFPYLPHFLKKSNVLTTIFPSLLSNA